MSKQSDKEIIYASYDNCYYGFHFSNKPTLSELDKLYNNILNSKFSNKIKRKLMSRLKFKIRFIEAEEDMINKLREEFNFKLN